jgi:hypothetical protein
MEDGMNVKAALVPDVLIGSVGRKLQPVSDMCCDRQSFVPI